MELHVVCGIDLETRQFLVLVAYFDREKAKTALKVLEERMSPKGIRHFIRTVTLRDEDPRVADLQKKLKDANDTIGAMQQGAKAE